MKLPRKNRGETSATLTQTLGLMAGCSALLILSAYASDPTAWNDPAWWSAPGPNGLSAVMPEQVITNAITGVVTTNYIADNNAVVTQGQLKQFTARAVDELNSGLSGGAGSDLSSMVSNWAQDYATNGYNATNLKPSDYTAMTVGQLKYIGNKVWSQLVAAGYTNAVPSWLAQNTSTDNELANIGQLKEIFNFSPSVAPPAGPSNLTVTASNPGELDLIWTNNASNATSITIKMSTDGGVTWTNVTTLTDATINSYAVTGLSSGSNYQFQVTANNTAGPSPTTTTTSPPSPPVPRYAVIDFGTNFYPQGINSTNEVVGYSSPGTTNQVPAYWSWSSNTNVALPANPAYQFPATNYTVVGVDDAGHIAGSFGGAWFTIPPSSDPWDTDQDVYYFLGCYWTNSTSTPIALGQGESSDNGDFPFWDSVTASISGPGFIVGNAGYASVGSSSPCHVEQFNPAWMVGTSNEAHVVYPPNPWPANEYGTNFPLDTNAVVTGAGGATNWCGYGETFNYGYFSPVSPIINGTMYTASAYGNLSLGAINDSNIAAGGAYNSSNGSFTAEIVSPGPGGTLLSTNLGPGTAQDLNNQLATNGTPLPQVIGYDTNYPANPMLWDKTTYAGTAYTNAATGNYLGKNLSLLLPGTTNSPWTMTGVSGINNAGSIIGSANYSGSNTNIAAGVHGVELIPISIVRETTNGSGVFMPIKDNGLDDNAQLPIFTTESGTGRARTQTSNAITVTLNENLSSTSTATMTINLQNESGTTDSGTLTETAAGSGVFTNNGGTTTVTLSPATQTTDNSTVDKLNVQVSDSNLSLVNQSFTLQESAVSSKVFNVIPYTAIVTLSSSLSTTAINTINLDVITGTYPFGTMLTETAINSRIFQDSLGTSATITNYTGDPNGSMNVAITGSFLPSTGFIASLSETTTSLQYANYKETIGNVIVETPETDGQGIFYIQMPGSASTSITLQSGSNQVTVQAVPVPGKPNLLRTGKLVLINPGDSFSASDITTLAASPPSGGGSPTLQLKMYGQTIVDPGTVGNAYLCAFHPRPNGTIFNNVDVEGHLENVQKCLTVGGYNHTGANGPIVSNGLGWTGVPYATGPTKSQILAEIPNHAIFYYYGFGASTVQDVPPLNGISCYADPGATNSSGHALDKEEITPTDIANANVIPDSTVKNHYRLVFLNACLTNDQSTGSAAPDFFSSFNTDVYVGWNTPQWDNISAPDGEQFFALLAQKDATVASVIATINTGPAAPNEPFTDPNIPIGTNPTLGFQGKGNTTMLLVAPTPPPTP